MRRALALAALVPALALAAPAAGAGGLRITDVDVGAYPTVKFAVVTPRALARPPAVLEGGSPAAGIQARNLGRQKSVVLVVDRSQSMAGQAIADAAAAARGFVAAKPAGDRISVVAVASKAQTLTGFSSATIDADSALRTVEVDRVMGTALYDSVVMSAEALAEEPEQGRVIILLTDGQETTSESSLDAAIRAARGAGAAVYPIGIESADFRPDPLVRLARETGGTYHAAATTAALAGAYSRIADELSRTWRFSYQTAARPGEAASLRVTVPGLAAVSTQVDVPSGFGAGSVEPASGPELPGLFLVEGVGPVMLGLAVGGLLLAAFLVLGTARPGSRVRRKIDPHVELARRSGRSAPRERFAMSSSVLKATEQAFGHLRVWARLHRLIERSDVPLKTVELVYICVGVGFAVGLLVAVTGAAPPFILIAMALGACGPVGVLTVKARRRLLAIETQLPDLLTTIAASLKAGHSFRQGLQAVVDEGQPPASTEFKRVLTEARLGRPMDEALTEMSERVGSKDLTFVITAVTIQRQVGGSLAGIFDMVADTVRQRQQFQRKIRGLTAMGRMSAWVLMGIPFFLAAMIFLLNREYMEPLFTTSTGHTLIMVGLGMMAMGSLFLRKIVSFKG